jgi:hypothetical protein
MIESNSNSLRRRTAFKAGLGPAQLTIQIGDPVRSRTLPRGFGDRYPPRGPSQNWCSILESNQADPSGCEVYSLAGVRPRLMLHGWVDAG